MSPPIKITLTDEEYHELTRLISNGKTERRLAERAAIILDSCKGIKAVEIAARLRIHVHVVSKWRRRFLEYRTKGLHDAPRSGTPRKMTAEVEKRILSVLDRNPIDGFSQWNGRLIAKYLGDVSPAQVWSVMRRNGIDLQRRHSWCISTDPEFESKAADIVGLYLAPPENAVVLCVDEKPCIQAIEHEQGWLRLPDGKTFLGFSDRYKRNGSSTLFAALELATGRVLARNSKRKRRREFLDFMNDVVDAYPEKELHVVLDNLSTHSKKDDRWLKAHRNVHLHFTPTNASWLNQIEMFFSILQRGALQGGSFDSVKHLRDAINKFIACYNETSVPFEWKKTCVNPKKLQKTYSNLSN